MGVQIMRLRQQCSSLVALASVLCEQALRRRDAFCLRYLVPINITMPQTSLFSRTDGFQLINVLQLDKTNSVFTVNNLTKLVFYPLHTHLRKDKLSFVGILIIPKKTTLYNFQIYRA